MLFCDTEFNGWEENRTHLDQYTGRPLECLAKYGADFLGLESWFELEGSVDFKAYDLIWVYLGHRYMKPAWYSFPRLIRNYAPDAKIVFTVDYEGLWYGRDLDLRMKLAWEEADFMHTITDFGYKYFTEELSIPVHYGTFGRPYAGGIKSLPRPFAKSRRTGVCFIRHTNVPPIMTQLEVIKKMRMKAIGIDSVPQPFSDGSYLPYMADAFRVKGDFYPRLEFSQYLDVIKKAYVGLDNHVGPSRFSYEMASLGVPVVHSRFSEYGNSLFPMLTCNHDSIGDMYFKIKSLRKSKRFYQECIDQAAFELKHYFNVNTCQRRLELFMEKVMRK